MVLLACLQSEVPHALGISPLGLSTYKTTVIFIDTQLYQVSALEALAFVKELVPLLSSQ